MSKPPSKTMNNLFRLVNLLVMPFWLLMILAPRADLTRKVMNSRLLFALLGGIYAALLGQGVVQNPAGFKDVSNPDLAGLTRLMAQPQGTFTAWTHMLAMDLFVGRWIYLDSLEKDRPARLALFLTLMAGPAGLLYYLGRSGITRPLA